MDSQNGLTKIYYEDKIKRNGSLLTTVFCVKSNQNWNTIWVWSQLSLYPGAILGIRFVEKTVFIILAQSKENNQCFTQKSEDQVARSLIHLPKIYAEPEFGSVLYATQ